MDPTHRVTDLTIESSPMPPAFSGTLQEAFDVLVERLRIVSPFKLLRVVVSDVAPTSNQGLWLKFGTKPYVWDESTSTYIPLDIDDSLSYPFDTLVDIILANFDPTTKYLLANRINATAQLSDKIITAAKFVDAFGTPKSIITIDAAGKATFTVVTPGQTVFADPSTGVPVAGLLPVASIAPGTLGQTITTVDDGGLKSRWTASPRYNSTVGQQQVLPGAGTSAQFLHGLGVVPTRFGGHFVCVAADPIATSFAVGDKIEWTSPQYQVGGDEIYSLTMAADLTKVYLQMGDVGPEGLEIRSKTADAVTTLTYASWKCVAWADAN